MKRKQDPYQNSIKLYFDGAEVSDKVKSVKDQVPQGFFQDPFNVTEGGTITPFKSGSRYVTRLTSQDNKQEAHFSARADIAYNWLQEVNRVVIVI